MSTNPDDSKISNRNASPPLCGQKDPRNRSGVYRSTSYLARLTPPALRVQRAVGKSARVDVARTLRGQHSRRTPTPTRVPTGAENDINAAIR